MEQMTLFGWENPVMDVFDSSRCYSKQVNHETAKKICLNHHYARRVPSIVAAFGLYVDNVLGGVITYGIPANKNQMNFCGEEFSSHGLELNRLFCFDWAGKNSESWLIGQSFKLLRQYYPQYFILISYADPEQDHLGTIYQATNWLYTGIGGGTNDFYVNGQKLHQRSVHNMFGTQDKEVIRDMGWDIHSEKKEGKHRYVYFLGDKRTRKFMKSRLKWDTLPYPKG